MADTVSFLPSTSTVFFKAGNCWHSWSHVFTVLWKKVLHSGFMYARCTVHHPQFVQMKDKVYLVTHPHHVTVRITVPFSVSHSVAFKILFRHKRWKKMVSALRHPGNRLCVLFHLFALSKVTGCWLTEETNDFYEPKPWITRHPELSRRLELLYRDSVRKFDDSAFQVLLVHFLRGRNFFFKNGYFSNEMRF